MNEASPQPPNGVWEAAEGKQVELAPTETVPLVYANNVSLRMTVFDVMLDFSVIVGSDKDSLRFRPVVSVAMSPQHAKALAELLTKHVQEYERQFGKIPEGKPIEAGQKDKSGAE